MLKKLTNNLGWKILSVFLAFALWLFVMDYEDPTITKTFDGITVEKLNIESEALKNKYIEYKEGEEVEVVVRGPRSLIDNMTYRDIDAYVDFNKISFTGAIDIQVDVSNYSDSVTVISKDPTDMLVEYEDIISEQRRVQYYFEGELPEDYIAEEPIFSPSYIEITGPESEVNAVSSVLVSIPIENERKDITLRAKPQILDSNNNVVNMVETSTDEISVTVPVEKIKTVPITFENIGTVAEDHRLMDVLLSESEVTIIGDAEQVDQIDDIILDTIDLTEKTINEEVEVIIADLLPNNIELYSEVGSLTVTILIEPIVEKAIEISHSDITVKYLPDNMQFSYLSDDVIEIKLVGVQRDLGIVDTEYLSPYIRLYELYEGEHEVRLYYTIPYNIQDLSSDIYVSVSLSPSVGEAEGEENVEAGEAIVGTGEESTEEVVDSEENIEETNN